MIIQHKNISIFYEDEGQGDAIILLHGFLENSSMWNDIKPGLLKNNRVVCVDLLGHGQTPCLGYIHTMNDMAEAVLVVLAHLKLKTYTLIGHSMGGYVALALAEKNPKAVSGLCLMNSTYKADNRERKILRKRANSLAKTNYEALVSMSFTNLFSLESRESHKSEVEKALKQALLTPVQSYIAAQEGMRLREDKGEFFKALVAKKLIITGMKDPVVDGKLLLEDTENTDILCEQLSLGHMSHIENKYELSYLLIRFIE